MSNLTDPSSPSTGETRAFDDELDAATCQFPIHRGRRPRIRPVLSPRAARTTRVTPPRVGQLQTPKSKSNGIVDQTFETGDLAWRQGSTASIAFAHHERKNELKGKKKSNNASLGVAFSRRAFCRAASVGRSSPPFTPRDTRHRRRAVFVFDKRTITRPRPRPRPRPPAPPSRRFRRSGTGAALSARRGTRRSRPPGAAADSTR